MIKIVDSKLLNKKIADIIEFLRNSQGEDGEFRTLRFFCHQVEKYVAKTEYEDWYYFGKCPFCTASIVHHLSEVDMPYVKEIIKKACGFLEKGNENGLYRYIPRYAKPIHFPTDIDDTSLSLHALKENGYSPRENLPMIFGNSASNGNFYTWFIPRWRHLRNFSNFVWLTRDFVRCYRKTKSFSQSFGPKFREFKRSAEPAITANVILFLGENSQTEKTIDRLIEQITNGDVTLQYYSNILFLYFHVARLYHRGIERFGILKEKIFLYLSERQQENGEIENGFNTATAALILIYFGYWGSEVVEKAIHYLLEDQMHEQGWKPMPYCNDLDGVFIEGGAEFTATLYLEAFYRYNKHMYAGTEI